MWITMWISVNNYQFIHNTIKKYCKIAMYYVDKKYSTGVDKNNNLNTGSNFKNKPFYSLNNPLHYSYGECC
jgi:hypothetical protein